MEVEEVEKNGGGKKTGRGGWGHKKIFHVFLIRGSKLSFTGYASNKNSTDHSMKMPRNWIPFRDKQHIKNNTHS